MGDEHPDDEGLEVVAMKLSVNVTLRQAILDAWRSKGLTTPDDPTLLAEAAALAWLLAEAAALACQELLAKSLSAPTHGTTKPVG